MNRLNGLSITVQHVSLMDTRGLGFDNLLYFLSLLSLSSSDSAPSPLPLANMCHQRTSFEAAPEFIFLLDLTSIILIVIFLFLVFL